uniref:Uncharacterized protein n=1 Tax=Meloidogyne hapla TaxID=6305 RepID=A0A1I8BGL2_MELHA
MAVVIISLATISDFLAKSFLLPETPPCYSESEDCDSYTDAGSYPPSSFNSPPHYSIAYHGNLSGNNANLSSDNNEGIASYNQHHYSTIGQTFDQLEQPFHDVNPSSGRNPGRGIRLDRTASFNRSNAQLMDTVSPDLIHHVDQQNIYNHESPKRRRIPKQSKNFRRQGSIKQPKQF